MEPVCEAEQSLIVGHLPRLYGKRLHIGIEPVCEAEQSLIAGHLQVKVHIIRGVGVEELPGTP